MNRILFFLCLLPFLGRAQTRDLLVLKKHGGHVQTYTVGMGFTMETIYHQWLSGTITDMRNDTVFLDGNPFNYKEIAAINNDRRSWNYAADGSILMIAGGGVFVLGAVNGMLRKDPANAWYTTTSYITGGTLLVGGWLLRKAASRKYHIGHKYQLEYLSLRADKKG